MHGFFSFSVPHLGTLKHHIKVNKIGMWFVKTFGRSTAINQLNLTDQKVYEQCKVFQLASDKGMSWFKHLVLLSSHQDGYVPYDSARIQSIVGAKKDRQQVIKDRMVE